MPRQPLDDFLEKLNVTAVVTRNTDRHHIFLQSSPRDVLCRTIVPEINHFNAMTNKFQIDRVNGTIVTVTNRDCCQNPNHLERRSCRSSGVRERREGDVAQILQLLNSCNS